MRSRRLAVVAVPPGGLIIPMIIQTIRLDPSGPDATDDPSHLSRSDPSGTDQIDAEHQATDLAVGASSPSRRASSRTGMLVESCGSSARARVRATASTAWTTAATTSRQRGLDYPGAEQGRNWRRWLRATR
jgi:hypothetical protein